LRFLLALVRESRQAIERGAFATWKADALARFERQPLET